jgi:hypothetical protein
MRLRRRRVRLHLKNNAPSIDGLLVGTVDGHYHLKIARLVTAGDDADVQLDGDIEVPRLNVLFLQRLGAA